jgi:hypothetical protein
MIVKKHPWCLELQQYNCEQGIFFIDLVIFNYLFGERTLSAAIMHCDLLAGQQEIMHITRSQISCYYLINSLHKIKHMNQIYVHICLNFKILTQHDLKFSFDYWSLHNIVLETTQVSTMNPVLASIFVLQQPTIKRNLLRSLLQSKETRES